jgi:hypothetical protein
MSRLYEQYNVGREDYYEEYIYCETCENYTEKGYCALVGKYIYPEGQKFYSCEHYEERDDSE